MFVVDILEVQRNWRGRHRRRVEGWALGQDGIWDVILVVLTGDELLDCPQNACSFLRGRQGGEDIGDSLKRLEDDELLNTGQVT